MTQSEYEAFGVDSPSGEDLFDRRIAADLWSTYLEARPYQSLATRLFATLVRWLDSNGVCGRCCNPEGGPRLPCKPGCPVKEHHERWKEIREHKDEEESGL